MELSLDTRKKILDNAYLTLGCSVCGKDICKISPITSRSPKSDGTFYVVCLSCENKINDEVDKEYDSK